MIISPAKLSDFEYMSTHEIGCFYGGMLRGWAKKPEQIIVTVINRLAWLIKKMERTPSDGTAACAHWYLDHIDAHVPLPPQHGVFTDAYINRLQQALDAHEARIGYPVLPDWFGRLVGNDETRIRWVLYGPPMRTEGAWGSPSMATPEGQLHSAISYYCWRSGLNN
jgi:hypothetical protein